MSEANANQTMHSKQTTRLRSIASTTEQTIQAAQQPGHITTTGANKPGTAAQINLGQEQTKLEYSAQQAIYA
jgi:transposase